MSGFERTGTYVESWDDRCDTRIWSGVCEHDESSPGSEKYLCVACGKIPVLDHEVRHELFPHISGDTDSLY